MSYGNVADLGSGGKTLTVGVVDCIKALGGNIWFAEGTMHSSGSATMIQFSSELRSMDNGVPSIYQRGLGGKLTDYFYVFEIYE